MAPGAPQALDCGQCHAINVAPLRVRVRGEILTHSIGVVVPDDALARLSGEASSTGTLVAEIRLPDRDRQVVVALFEGYLRPFPNCQPWPRTYEEAARRLGAPWTRDKVRKQVERLKVRLSKTGPPLDGPRANHDLAEYLLGNDVIGPGDLWPPTP